MATTAAMLAMRAGIDSLMHQPPTLSKLRGVSLIELLTAMAIVGILSVIAFPAFIRMVADQRVRTAASDLMADLAYSRAEAIKRSSRVGLSRVGNEWKDGWQVFVDANRDGVQDATEAVLKVHSALQPSLIVCSVGSNIDPSFFLMTYGADGRLRFFDHNPPDREGKNGIAGIVISSTRGTPGRARTVAFSPSGRVSIDTSSAPCP